MSKWETWGNVKVKKKPAMFKMTTFEVKCERCGIEFITKGYIKPQWCKKCVKKMFNEGNFDAY